MPFLETNAEAVVEGSDGFATPPERGEERGGIGLDAALRSSAEISINSFEILKPISRGAYGQARRASRSGLA